MNQSIIPVAGGYYYIALMIATLLVLRSLLLQSSWRYMRIGAEACLGLGLYFVYYIVRGVVKDQIEQARANAGAVINVERHLGLFHEMTLQRLAIELHWPVIMANWVYVWAFWPPIFAVFIWLYLRHNAEYFVYRNAMLLSGAMGLVTFALFPVAPPRFVSGLAFVDTVTQRSYSSHVLLPQGLANKFAAMPSLHVGWCLLVSTALVRFSPHLALRILGYIMPVAMLLTVMATGNHYFLDGVVGALYVAAALKLSIALTPSTRTSSLEPARKLSRAM